MVEGIMPIPNYPHLVSGGDVIELSYVHTYIHTYIVSVTEAALSKLAAIFQFIQFSLAKYSPHTYSLQYPLYCILKSKGVANKAASLVTSWGGKRLLRKSSHVSMITTRGIGDKGEGGLKTWFWTHEPIPSQNVQKKNLPKSTPFEHALHECPQMG